MAFEPTPAAVAGLAQHLRDTLRTFPLAELAKVVLASRERYQARFTSAPEGPTLYQCIDDRSLWLSRDEAVAHFLGSPLVETYYEVREVEVDPPKGQFASVAVCGLSGTVLGPSSHHDYQRKLRRLHAERFSHMPLERYLSRVRNDSSEEALEQWRASVSRRTGYFPKEQAAEGPAEEGAEAAGEGAEAAGELAAAAPAEASESPAEEGAGAEGEPESAAEAPEEAPDEEGAEAEGATEAVEEAPAPSSPSLPSLKSREELVDHFKARYAAEAIIERREAVVPGNVPGKLVARGLLTLLKAESERLRRGFPLAMIQAICRGLESENLRFFKRGKKALHVSAVSPKAIDPGAVLTPQVQRIVDCLAARPRCKVAELLEALVEDFIPPKQDSPHEKVEFSPAAKSVLKDLRWLTAEGFILEFADTSLAIAKQHPPAPGASAAPPAKKAARKAREAGQASVAKPARGAARAPEPSAGPAVAHETADPVVELDPATSDFPSPGDPDELPGSTDPVGEGEAW